MACAGHHKRRPYRAAQSKNLPRGLSIRTSDAEGLIARGNFPAHALQNRLKVSAQRIPSSHRVARDSLRRLVEGQEQERRRLARELHDETGQALTSVLLGLKAVEDAQDAVQLRSATGKLRELVVATLQDVRRLAVELRPKALDDFGLVPAVERLVQTFAEATGIEVQLEAQVSSERLPSAVETTLYRTVQEGLTNIARHAGAHRVSVLLMRRDGSVTAVIEDDGHGFAAEDLEGGGMGLDAMRERVALLDGRLAIESTPGGGTTLVVEAPAA